MLHNYHSKSCEWAFINIFSLINIKNIIIGLFVCSYEEQNGAEQSQTSYETDAYPYQKSISIMCGAHWKDFFFLQAESLTF